MGQSLGTLAQQTGVYSVKTHREGVNKAKMGAKSHETSKGQKNSDWRGGGVPGRGLDREETLHFWVILQRALMTEISMNGSS